MKAIKGGGGGSNTLLVNAKNAFNSFVGRVLANSQQVVFARITKIATKNVVLQHICKYMDHCFDILGLFCLNLDKGKLPCI